MIEQKFVVFLLGQERYAIPIDRVERILPDQAITRLPRTPKMFLGVFDLRGETVPTIDLRLRFEMPENPEPGNLVVVFTSSGRCAFRVDTVDGIVNLTEADIDKSPDLFDRKGDDFIAGIGKVGEQLIVLLECDEIIPQKLRKTISQATQLQAA